MQPVQIAVLAKAPIAGLAKTRLIPALGAAGAARLQRALTRLTLQQALQSQVGPVHLWCTPDRQQRFFRALQRTAPVTLQQQPDGDLGQRMQAVFERHCGAGPVLLIGTDCPGLGSPRLRAAAQALQAGDEAVFHPAEDGGYALVGLRHPRPALFSGVHWGTSRVMAQTRQRAAAAGVGLRELALLWDVDLPQDLPRLAIEHPELRALLHRHGWRTRSTAAPRAPAG